VHNVYNFKEIKQATGLFNSLFAEHPIQRFALDGVLSKKTVEKP
jgi:hypothetical protein